MRHILAVVENRKLYNFPAAFVASIFNMLTRPGLSPISIEGFFKPPAFSYIKLVERYFFNNLKICTGLDWEREVRY